MSVSSGSRTHPRSCTSQIALISRYSFSANTSAGMTKKSTVGWPTQLRRRTRFSMYLLTSSAFLNLCASPVISSNL